MARTMLLGEAPGKHYDGAPAFSSKSGQYLSALIGADVREVFWCYNLLKRWPGKSSGKGALFPLAMARQRADAICKTLHQRHAAHGAEHRIILAGRRVAAAMKVRPEVPLMEWTGMWVGSTSNWYSGITVAVLPHPSGVNRWWNSEENRMLAKAFLLDEARLTGRLPQ